MLDKIAKFIEKHPWLVVIAVILITIGFATLLPFMEMKTDFKDFMPDDETVKAVLRINDYFGQNQQMMLIYLEKQKTESVITPEALKEQYYIQKELSKNPNVDGFFGVLSIVDQVCQIEFGKTFENCTDEQIKIAVKDIFENNGVTTVKVLDTDDQNEEYDYKRYQKLKVGWEINEIDIKNCYIDFNDEKITFSIEVYDLSAFESKFKSPIPLVNVLEWYIDFDNLIKPDERLNISYRISAHFEPKHPIWVIGKGLKNNLKDIYNNLLEQELFSAYRKDVYLWIKSPGQAISFPILLKTGEITFDLKRNIIKMEVSREEIGQYGIAPRFGSFELPAKLTNFRCGVRYYQTSLPKLSWLRIAFNTSFLFEKFYNLKNKPLLSNVVEKLMIKFANITWEDFEKIFAYMSDNISLPEEIGLKDIEFSWKQGDIAPDEGYSDAVLFYKPYFFKDLQISAKGVLSKNYRENKNPPSCIILVWINSSGSYESNLRLNSEIYSKVKELNRSLRYLSMDATGDGIISTQINSATSEANKIIGPLIFVMITVVLFISFWRISYVFLPMIALLISVTWLFGTMVLLGMPFNTLAVAIFPIIMGLGVDYSVHLSHNYRIELARGRSPSEAIKISVVETGTALLLAMVTTVIAFLSFLSSDVPPVRDFGLLLAIGLIYAFIVAISFQPAVRYIIDRRKQKFNIKLKERFKIDNFMRKVSKKIIRHQKKILAGVLVFTIFACFSATQLKTTFDIYSFLPSDNPSLKLYENIRKEFPFSSQDVEYILLEGNVATVDTLKGIARTYEKIEDDSFISRDAEGNIRTTSVYSIIKQAVSYNSSLIEAFNIDKNSFIPKSDSDVKRLYDYLYQSEEFGFRMASVVHRNEKGEYDATTINIYIDITSSDKKTEDTQKNLEILSKELNDDLDNYGKVSAIATGPLVITNKIMSSLLESQISSTIISIIISAIILMVIYRRPTLGLITMTPVLFSTVWILGAMYIIGYDLNVLTITVTSLTIGIGIDYAIHATERFKLVADKTGNITAAVVETISRTGTSLLISALTTIFGFGVLIFAPLPPEVQFGVIVTITVSFSYLLSILLLPILLAHWGKWSKRKKGYIISTKPAEKGYLEREYEESF